MAKNTVVVSVLADTKQLAGGLRGAESHFSALKALAAGATAVIGGVSLAIGAIAAKGLDRALNLQDAKAQLTGLGHSADSVSAIMGSALDSVRGTAFGLDSAATIAASAVAAGIAPGEALTRTLKLTADAATIGKASLSEMGDMVNKVATNGTLTTEVLNQFQTRGIPLLQAVADQYGVTADEASKMVTRGEVDFATFQTALDSKVGGAALSSGATARGAFANIGAAFGRLGAMFTGSSVEAAPGLFVAIAGAADRLAEGLQPLADKFSGSVTPAVEALSGWIDGLDFSGVGATLVATFDTIQNAFSTVVSAFQTGDFSALGATFGDIAAVSKPLFPLFIELAKGMGGIAGSVGKVVAAGFPLLVPILEGFANVLSFVGDNPGILAAGLIAIGAAFLISKAGMLANNAAMAASIPLRYAEVITRFQLTAALGTHTAALTGNSIAERRSLGAKAAALGATIASTAANIGARIALVAGAVATGIATAAQWALNAAMTANPIGLVIAAVVALVAGLIWFFTQTELGKEIWSNFTRFLGEAWENTVAWITSVVDGIVSFFTDAWSNISNGVTTAWTAIGDFFVSLWDGIVSFFSDALAWVVDMFMNWTVYGLIIQHWDEIMAFFAAIPQWIADIFASAIKWLTDAGKNIISGLQNGVLGAWNAVVGFFTGIYSTVLGFLSGAVGWLVDAGRNIIDGLINGLRAAAGSVGAVLLDIAKGAIDGFLSFFGIHSPSRLMEGFGINIDDGLARGIKKGAGAIGRAMGFVNDAVTDNLELSLDPNIELARVSSRSPRPSSAAAAAGPIVVELSAYDRKLLADAGNMEVVIPGVHIAKAVSRQNLTDASRRNA